MLSLDQRRALQLLADAPHGCTEAVLIAHGLADVLGGLVRDGLATAAADRIQAGWREVEVVRLRITDAGRRALGPA